MKSALFIMGMLVSFLDTPAQTKPVAMQYAFDVHVGDDDLRTNNPGVGPGSELQAQVFFSGNKTVGPVTINSWRGGYMGIQSHSNAIYYITSDDAGWDYVKNAPLNIESLRLHLIEHNGIGQTDDNVDIVTVGVIVFWRNIGEKQWNQSEHICFYNVNQRLTASNPFTSLTGWVKCK